MLNQRTHQIISLSLLALATALSAPAFAQTAERSLEEQFQNPPNSARPRVWWHWMNGNITQDGIAKDFAWMKRVGIGGVQNFDANLDTPQAVEKRLVYMTPEWKDAFRFAATEADRLGLELTIAASPGWSETGGPWVPEADGMKKLVWSEMLVEGGRPVASKLQALPTNTGPYQNMLKPGGIGELLMGLPAKPSPHRASGSVAVLAVPEATAKLLPQPVVTSTDGKAVDAALLSDGAYEKDIKVAGVGSELPSLTLTYPAPQTVRSARLYVPGGNVIFIGETAKAVLEASPDGKSWQEVADLAIGSVPTTASFAPITAAKFRVRFSPILIGFKEILGEPSEGVDGFSFSMVSSMQFAPRVAELSLSGDARIDQAETKAGYTIAADYYGLSKELPDLKGVDPARVINLTGKLGADGTLNWTPPKGTWRILHLGWSLIGTENHPAPKEATGLEVDKFDGDAVRRYLNTYIGMYGDASGGMVGKRGVNGILTDSIEVGASNWTPKMVDQFKRLRGYDPTPWLPALTGVIIGSRAESDKFLYDFRRTLADLIASEHYGTVATVAREKGMIVYGEALENGRPSLGDDMAMRRHATVPMAAMWTYKRHEGPKLNYIADIRGAASVAHIYGQNLVAAESLTSSQAYWDYSPASLRRIIDLEFVNGVNRPVIHTSVHQPVDDKFPGISLGQFGQFFNRHDSWAEMAKPWVDYMSRNSFMLQQGRHVADVAYFYGEEGPLTQLYKRELTPDAPRSYGWDYINADALIGALSVQGGDLVTPGGARYKALYLGGTSKKMSLPVLRQIAKLVDDGATVIGEKPEADPGLASDAAEYAALVGKLWSGNPRVIASRDVEASLSQIGVTPDFSFKGADGANINFLHRKLADGDSYFIVNHGNRAEKLEAYFRVLGKEPELWDAVTGKSEPVSYRIEGGQTIIPLDMFPEQSVHMVFRKSATANSLTVTKPATSALSPVTSPWTVSFQAGRGAPSSVVMNSLTPLEKHGDVGIKYFSGIASYANSFTTPKGWRAGQPLSLDLGMVHEMAEVIVNGKSAGHAWTAPYRVDIGSLTKKGKNALEIRVANLWVNRLAGDAQPGAKKITWTSQPKTYRANTTLRPSGLIGPVALVTE